MNNRHYKEQSKSTPIKKKQIWKVKKEIPNWLKLPPEVMSIILLKLGSIKILNSAQKVCLSWHKICKDPFMWRSIDLHHSSCPIDFGELKELARKAIDRSCGQCVNLDIDSICDDSIIRYIAEKCPQLRRLQFVSWWSISNEELNEAISKLPYLEEIDIFIGPWLLSIDRCCPNLKSFKLERTMFTDLLTDSNDLDREALAIATNMPGLNHLTLFGNTLSNVGLQAILDNCPNLVSLDLRRCYYIDLSGDLRKRCADLQIKNRKTGPFW